MRAVLQARDSGVDRLDFAPITDCLREILDSQFRRKVPIVKRSVFLLLLTMIASAPLVCLAQGGFGQGTGGSGGGGGGMGGGGMGAGGGFGGGGNTGGMGMGGNSLGGNSLGNTGMGGMGGFGQNTGAGGAGMAGQQQGQQQFLGRTNNQNGAFLGRTAQGQTGQMGNQQQGANRRTGGNRNNNNNQMMNMANQQQQAMGGNGSNAVRQFPQVRPRQKVGFEYSKPQLVAVTGNVQTRFQTRSELSGVNVSLEPTGEVVIRGQVASAEKAKLAENLARLEPGVTKVRNELSYPDAIE
jgi:osmotically-inducible protein OsmY